MRVRIQGQVQVQVQVEVHCAGADTGAGAGAGAGAGVLYRLYLAKAMMPGPVFFGRLCLAKRVSVSLPISTLRIFRGT